MKQSCHIVLLTLFCVGISIPAYAEDVPCANIPVLPADGFVTVAMVQKAVQYPGKSAERDMIDLLKADFHMGKTKYFLNRKKAGFMANERFDLAFERAIGDIRLLTKLTADTERESKAIETYRNWQGAFRRAQRRDVPRA